MPFQRKATLGLDKVLALCVKTSILSCLWSSQSKACTNTEQMLDHYAATYCFNIQLYILNYILHTELCQKDNCRYQASSGCGDWREGSEWGVQSCCALNGWKLYNVYVKVIYIQHSSKFSLLQNFVKKHPKISPILSCHWKMGPYCMGIAKERIIHANACILCLCAPLHG